MLIADAGTWFIGTSLIVVGVVLAGVSLWMWIGSRPDDPLLAPLEVIGNREFAAGTPEERAAMLKKARTTVLS